MNQKIKVQKEFQSGILAETKKEMELTDFPHTEEDFKVKAVPFLGRSLSHSMSVHRSSMRPAKSVIRKSFRPIVGMSKISDQE